jgi:hypothetical protein
MPGAGAVRVRDGGRYAGRDTQKGRRLPMNDIDLVIRAAQLVERFDVNKPDATMGS